MVVTGYLIQQVELGLGIFLTHLLINKSKGQRAESKNHNRLSVERETKVRAICGKWSIINIGDRDQALGNRAFLFWILDF